MKRREASDPIANNKNPLTSEEAARIADRVAGAESEDAALVLLLCFALAYEPDGWTRDAMYGAIEQRIAPLLADFTPMVKTELRGHLKALREEGSRLRLIRGEPQSDADIPTGSVAAFDIRRARDGEKGGCA